MLDVTLVDARCSSFYFFCWYQTFGFAFVDFRLQKILFCDGYKENARRDYSEKIQSLQELEKGKSSKSNKNVALNLT